MTARTGEAASSYPLGSPVQTIHRGRHERPRLPSPSPRRPGWGTAAPSATVRFAAAASPPPRSPPGSLVILGRIVTMDEPPIAEALFIEDGTVAAVGTGDEVLALAGDGCRSSTSATRRLPRVHRRPRPLDRRPRVLRDRHGRRGHRRGDQPRLDLDQRAVGQRERLDELTRLAADDALPLRVDAYLALNFDTRVLRGLVRGSRAWGRSATACGSAA